MGFTTKTRKGSHPGSAELPFLRFVLFFSICISVFSKIKKDLHIFLLLHLSAFFSCSKHCHVIWLNLFFVTTVVNFIVSFNIFPHSTYAGTKCMGSRSSRRSRRNRGTQAPQHKEHEISGVGSPPPSLLCKPKAGNRSAHLCTLSQFRQFYVPHTHSLLFLCVL